MKNHYWLLILNKTAYAISYNEAYLQSNFNRKYGGKEGVEIFKNLQNTE